MDNFNLDGFQLVHFNDSSILHEKRVSLGLTQKQVAERAKITIQSYQRFESGERNIKTASFQLACRVIEALEMNISDFYHGEYVFGEKLCGSIGDIRFKKTGKRVKQEPQS